MTAIEIFSRFFRGNFFSNIKHFIFLFFFLGCIFTQENLRRVLWEEKIKEGIGYKGIVARIGDIPIYAETIYNKIMQSLYKMKDVGDEKKIIETGRKLFENELGRAIDIEIVEYYAKNKSITVKEEEVEKELKTIVNRFGGVRKFDKFLKNTSSTYESFKKDLRFNLLARKVHQSIFLREDGFFTSNPPDSFVKPEDIKLYYENNKSEFFIQPRLRGIWIVKEYKNKFEKREIIKYMKVIISLCRQGYSFYKMHKLYSDEIQPKTFKLYPLNIFEKELVSKIKNLKKKKGFHILTTGKKVYLLYIKKYKEGKQLLLFDERVYENIYMILYNEKITTMINQIKNEMKKSIIVKRYIGK